MLAQDGLVLGSAGGWVDCHAASVSATCIHVSLLQMVCMWGLTSSVPARLVASGGLGWLHFPRLKPECSMGGTCWGVKAGTFMSHICVCVWVFMGAACGCGELSRLCMALICWWSVARRPLPVCVRQSDKLLAADLLGGLA